VHDQTGPGPPQPRPRRQAAARLLGWPAALCLVLGAVALYWPALGNGFVNWDDPAYIVENPLIRRLDPVGLARMFGSIHYSDYLPVSLLSLALDYRFWSLDPLGYHLSAALLHGLNAVLLYLFFAPLGRRREVALAAAVLFLAHPVNVESVAWLSERKNLLALAFCLLSALAYRRAVGGPSPSPGDPASPGDNDTPAPEVAPGAHTPAGLAVPWYVLSVALFVVALLAKAAAVVLPALLLLYELCLRRARPGGAVLRLLPHGAAAALASAFTLVTQQAAGALAVDYGGPWTIALTMARVLWRYLVSLAAPVGLNHRYPVDTVSNPLDLEVIAGVLAVGLLAAVAARDWRGSRRRAFGIAWFFACLLPVLNIVPIPILRADRYLYFAAPGLFFALAETLGAWVLRAGGAPGLKRRAGACALLAAALVGAFVPLTVARQRVWRDSLTLWRDNVTRDPASHVGYAGLGGALCEVGRLEEGVAALQRALALEPRYADARLRLARCYRRMGRASLAEGEIREVLRLQPRHPEALHTLGLIHSQAGRHREAEQAFRRALELRPDQPQMRANVGNALLRQGRPAEAREEYLKALAWEPGNAAIRYHLGLAERQLNRRAEAEAAFAAAVEADPGYWLAWVALGDLAADAGDRDRADEYYHKALAAAPPDVENLYRQGLYFRGRREPRWAAEWLRAALARDPGHVEAHLYLAVALAELRDIPGAVRHFRKVLSLRPDHPRAGQIRQALQKLPGAATVPGTASSMGTPAGASTPPGAGISSGAEKAPGSGASSGPSGNTGGEK